MRKAAYALVAAGLAAVFIAPVVWSQAPGFPSTMPPGTVYGRTAITAGPGQAIPFGVLFGNLFNSGSAPTAHGLLVGEGTSSLNSVTMGDAQVLLGQTGADPAAKTLSGDATITDLGALTIANNAITAAKLFQGGANSVLCNPTAGTANFQACTPTQFQANILCAPQVSDFTTGAAATYTTPTCNSILPLYIELEWVGGGGSGAGSGTGGGNGTTGNNTTIVCNAVTYTGNGGGPGTNGGTSQPGGTGGTSTNGDVNITGGTGAASPSSAAAVQIGGTGGGSAYGGAGGAGTSTANASAAAANTGSGGGSAGTSAAVTGGSAGGAGGFGRKLVTSPPATCTYTVGAATTGGTGGTSGQNGGGGAAGRVRFTARWQ